MTAFAARAAYEVAGLFKETGSRAQRDRAERKRVLALAQRREIDVVLASELSRRGRSTPGRLTTLRELEAKRVSLITPSGLALAKAWGKRLGRQPGQRSESVKVGPKVLQLITEGRSYRPIGRQLGLSKNTVTEIVKRAKGPEEAPAA